MDNYHVVPSPKGWMLHKQGSDHALLSATTKQELIEAIPGFMANKVGSVKIHNVDGKIEEERTYPRSADPQRSKG